MYQESSSLLQSGITSANGDRKVDTNFYLYADAGNYRLVVLDETKRSQVAGVFVPYAKTATTWVDNGDASYRVPWRSAVYTDTALSNSLVTARDFDLTTGNITKLWKPVQWASNPNRSTNLRRTTYTYDSRKLYLFDEVNELNQFRLYAREYGTGTPLVTLGPNRPACVNTSCPTGSPTLERHQVRVDGLGRMIERYETFDDVGSSYVSRLVETNAYVDSTASTVTHQSAIEYLPSSSTTRFAMDKTELDGHGRVKKHTVFAQGSAPADQVTSFSYAGDGTLTQATIPDPTQNNSAVVAYTYTHDSLGRPLTIRRPDAVSSTDRSGVNLSYDGLTTTAIDYVGLAGGQPASTTRHMDVFGRLIELDEQRSASPVTWSTTTYEYTPADAVSKVTDAEGFATTLYYDLVGRRTKVTRGPRSWTYAYDANGNVTSVVTPCTGTLCATTNTSTTAYDDLDRPTSKALAPRALSTSDLTLFGASSETYTWDTGTNGIGRLAKWETFGPTGPAVSSISHTYSAAGQETATSETTNAAGYSNLTREISRTYDISGQTREVYYDDAIDTNCIAGSRAYYQYDNRGLPASVLIESCANHSNRPYSSLIAQRNVSGRVTKRYSQAGQGTITYGEENWSYDSLGRVTSQVINSGSPIVQVARQDVLYFGNDDPSSMDAWLGASDHKHFNFGYDSRHQITSVDETQLPNAFNATYTYTDAGRFDTALESAAALPNSDVKARDVTYVYSSTDPERVTSLKKNGVTGNFAVYTYDPPGNQLSRVIGSERLDYVYDGSDRLRRVTRKLSGVVQGSEEYWYVDGNQRYLVVSRDAAGTKTGAKWSIGEVEAAYDATGNATRAYSHVGLGTTVARLTRLPDTLSTLEYQYHGLGNNTLAAVEQTTGTINSSFVYAPFGEIIEATNAGGASAGLSSHNRRLNDKVVDELDALSYYGQRYYDRVLVSWTQPDRLFTLIPDLTIGKSARRANLYQFSLNNPLRYMDPDGNNARGSLFTYTTEAEDRDHYRAALEADSHWTKTFHQTHRSFHYDWSDHVKSHFGRGGGPFGSDSGGCPPQAECVVDPEEIEIFVEDLEIIGEDLGEMAADTVEGIGEAAGEELGELVAGELPNGQAPYEEITTSELTDRVQRVAEAASKRFTPDQSALVDLAKDARARGGTTLDNAKTLIDWANETCVPCRNDIEETHWAPNDDPIPHIHIGPVNHITVKL
jgi:RHS repeat-associated protein